MISILHNISSVRAYSPAQKKKMVISFLKAQKYPNLIPEYLTICRYIIHNNKVHIAGNNHSRQTTPLYTLSRPSASRSRSALSPLSIRPAFLSLSLSALYYTTPNRNSPKRTLAPCLKPRAYRKSSLLRAEQPARNHDNTDAGRPPPPPPRS